MTNSLQSYHHNIWAIQKDIKVAYPKKVCHMPARHVKKKEEKRYIPKEGMPHVHKTCKKKKKKNIAHVQEKQYIQGIFTARLP